MELTKLTCANGSWAWRLAGGARPGELLLDTTTGEMLEVLTCEQTDEDEWEIFAVRDQYVPRDTVT